MAGDPVVPFPSSASEQAPDPEERARRLQVEVDQLASKPTCEWMFYLETEGLAEKHGIACVALKKMIEATIKEREKKAREDRAEGVRAEKAKKQKKERAFKTLDALPEAEQERRLADLARDLEEDPATMREEFTDASSPPVDSEPELWPEAVDTAALLEELIAQLQRFIVFRHSTDATAVALWLTFSWIHAVATHSPNLAATSPEPDCGKSTLMGVLGRLTPRPFTSVELTGPALYRIVDRDHPTMIIDEADDLFHRKPDLRHVINAGWSRGTKIPRVVQGVVREFDPFCPKAIALKGTEMPNTTASRSIIIDLWPKRPEETVEVFPFADAPEFQELRRKLARWSADNATALAEAKPALPPGFHNRLAANWRLLLAIADHGGGAWPKQARAAATRLAQKTAVMSAGLHLLAALRRMLANRDAITSAEIAAELTADPSSEWCAYRGHGKITQWQIAALLRPYGIYPVALHPTKQSSLASRPEEFHLRALPEPYVNLSIHTAPDVRPLPWHSCQ
jgi:hypothetical protein